MDLSKIFLPYSPFHGPIILLCVAWIVFFFVPQPLTAQTDYPDFQDLYVNDFADILSASEEEDIRNRLLGLKTTTGVEATVLTLDSWMAYGTGDPDFGTFATNLFNAWEIGSAESNDGILVLIAMDEREIRFETGVGLENTLKEDLDDILDNEMLPLLAIGEFGPGMVVGATELADRVLAVRGSTTGTAATAPSQSDREVVSAPSTSIEGERSPAVTNQSPSWWAALTAGLAGLLGLGGIGGLTWFWTRPPKCPHCRLDLRKLGEQEDDAFLNEGQQLEERLNSVNYNVWVCDYDDYVDINRKNRIFSGYSDCPRCSHKTVSSRSRTLRAATQYSSGIKEVTETCQNCGNQRVRNVTLPRIQKSSGGSSYGSYSSSSSRSRSRSSSRSSFGGGRSRGGGSGRKF